MSAPLAPAEPLALTVDAGTLVAVQPGVPGAAGAAAAGAGAAGAGAISRSTPGRLKVKPNSLLASRAETEYVYVGRDLRRIAIVGATMFGLLFLLWILLVVFNFAGLYG